MRSWLAAVALATATAILLAGCAAGPAGPRPGTGIATSSRANGTRAQAMALARHLLAELSFPPGTKSAHVTSLPPPLRGHQGPGPGWAGGQEILVVPGNPRSALERLDAHAPFGTPTRYGSALPTWSGTLLPAPEPGIDAAQVSVGIAAYSGSTTLVAAYAYATWLPARTAAEHLDPSGFRAVTVGEDRLIPSSREVTRTSTDPAVIARLAAFVNGLPPAPALIGRSCAVVFSRYTLRFTARDANGPAVVVSTVECGTDGITVNGKPQPGLWDTHARLAAMARQLLGALPKSAHPGAAGRPHGPGYASRRLSTQNVTASRMAARTTKMPVSMPWNAQNLLAGW